MLNVYILFIVIQGIYRDRKFLKASIPYHFNIFSSFYDHIYMYIYT